MNASNWHEHYDKLIVRDEKIRFLEIAIRNMPSNHEAMFLLSDLLNESVDKDQMHKSINSIGCVLAVLGLSLPCIVIFIGALFQN